MNNIITRTVKMLRTLFIAGALFAFVTPAKSADLYAANGTTANVVSNVLSAGGYLIKAITWINTTTNAATIKFYDTATTTTTIVQEAYTKLGPGYATNMVSTFTNAFGIVVTNTTPGWFVPSASISQATNERPYVIQFVVPASGTFTLSGVNREVSQGLAVLPNQAGTYLLTYAQLQ